MKHEVIWTKTIKFRVPDDLYEELKRLKGKRQWGQLFIEDIIKPFLGNKNPLEEEIPIERRI